VVRTHVLRGAAEVVKAITMAVVVVVVAEVQVQVQAAAAAVAKQATWPESGQE